MIQFDIIHPRQRIFTPVDVGHNQFHGVGAVIHVNVGGVLGNANIAVAKGPAPGYRCINPCAHVHKADPGNGAAHGVAGHKIGVGQRVNIHLPEGGIAAAVGIGHLQAHGVGAGVDIQKARIRRCGGRTRTEIPQITGQRSTARGGRAAEGKVGRQTLRRIVDREAAGGPRIGDHVLGPHQGVAAAEDIRHNQPHIESIGTIVHMGRVPQGGGRRAVAKIPAPANRGICHRQIGEAHCLRRAGHPGIGSEVGRRV